MSSQTIPAPQRTLPHSLAFNLAGIAALVLLLAVGAAYLVDRSSRAVRVALPQLEDANEISQTLSGHELAIPAAWFRYGEQIKPGFTSQIDLRVLLRPVADGPPLPVDVKLLPRSRVRTSAALLDTVYLHQFTDETVSAIPGLVGKPMGRSSGYQGETVWYDPLSSNPFVAKCLQPAAMEQPAQCVRTVYLKSGIAAVYAFDARALQSWPQFDAQMERWLARIGAW